MAYMCYSKKWFCSIGKRSLSVFRGAGKDIQLVFRYEYPAINEKETVDGEGESVEAYDAPKQGASSVDCYAASPSGCYFGCCFANKTLIVWDTNIWTEPAGVAKLNKRANIMCFVPSKERVLVADRSGDVLSFCLNNLSAGGTVIMGHLSMLLGMCLNDIGNRLITADRDEKIRVSYYPNSYNIQSYCLGHTQFVSHVAYHSSLGMLVSASGDGTVRLWDYCAGIILYTWFGEDSPKTPITSFSVPVESKESLLPVIAVVKKKSLALLLVYRNLKNTLCVDANVIVEGNVLSAVFISHSKLLVVSNVEDHLKISLLDVSVDDNNVKAVDLPDDTTRLFIESCVYYDKEFVGELTVTADRADYYESLYKNVIKDNVTEYFARKKVRVDSKTGAPVSEVTLI